MKSPRFGRVGVGVNEAGKNSLLSQISLAAAPGGKLQNVFIGSDRCETATADGDSLGTRVAGGYCPEISVVEDQVGFCALQWKERKCAQRQDKLASGSIEHKSRTLLNGKPGATQRV